LILVTVGAQMPFDRMVRAIDGWARDRKRTDIYAQIGPTRWQPQSIEWATFLSPTEFVSRVKAADAIVSHAGMGSILTAMQHGKPILIMPRRGDLQETRNDHQVATAERFGERQGISVAMDENELVARLDQVDSMIGAAAISDRASDQLINAIREFIHDRQ
jgi:exopolysaccharide biosynthesis glucuronosyltransferase PssE